MHIVLTALPTLVIGIVFISMCEWSLHFGAMHRRLWPIGFVHRLHAGVHHGIFGADDTYHVQSPWQRDKVTMSWWACFVVVPLATLPFVVPTGVLMLLDQWREGFTALVCGFIVAAGYFGAYEWLHWCMHVPKGRFFETWRIYRWLKEHHRLHHLDPKKNGNVVLPIADLLFGTRRRTIPVVA